jgi:Cytochrome c
MKKIFKYLLILICIVIVAGLLGFAFIEIRGIPSYETQKINYKAHITPESVERGRKLALLLCANCHKNNSTGVLTGVQMMDAPKEFGKIFSQNITLDKTYGIGDWTDGELLYLLRTGIKRNGQYAPPYMAKLHHMADEDINAVISFLRYDDPMVAASPTPDHPCEPAFMTKFLCTVAWKPLKMPDHKIEMPDTNNAVEFGKYLAFNLDCFACHSADFKTMDVEHPEKSGGFFGGGNKTLNMEGREIVTQNLTPDNETGIGLWTEEKFVTALKYGMKDNEPVLRYPMVPYVHLTDNEAKAIYAYLKTVPAIKNKVPRSTFE